MRHAKSQNGKANLPVSTLPLQGSLSFVCQLPVQHLSALCWNEKCPLRPFRKVLSACPLSENCRFVPCCKQGLLTCPSAGCISLSRLPLHPALQEVLQDHCVRGMSSVPLLTEVHSSVSLSPHKRYNLQQLCIKLEIYSIHRVWIQELQGMGCLT